MKQSRKILLTDDDHKIYENWEFISKRSFQEEVVEYLIYEEKLVSINRSGLLVPLLKYHYSFESIVFCLLPNCQFPLLLYFLSLVIHPPLPLFLP